MSILIDFFVCFNSLVVKLEPALLHIDKLSSATPTFTVSWLCGCLCCWVFRFPYFTYVHLFFTVIVVFAMFLLYCLNPDFNEKIRNLAVLTRTAISAKKFKSSQYLIDCSKIGTVHAINALFVYFLIEVWIITGVKPNNYLRLIF